MFESSKKIKLLAGAIAIALHGLAGIGITNMQINPIKLPDITPPLQVEFIKPEPPKPEPIKEVVINNLQSPEPPTNTPPKTAVLPVSTPEPTPVEPEQVEPIKPEPIIEPEPEPVKEPEPIIEPEPMPEPEVVKEPEPMPEPVKPTPEVDEILAAQQRQQELWEAQQKILREQELERQKAEELEKARKAQEAELEAQRQQELERQRELERQKAQELENARKAKEAEEQARKAREAEEAEKARKAAEDAAKRKAAEDAAKANKNNDGDKGGNDNKKVVNVGTLNASSASWKVRPNFSGLHSDTVEAISLNTRLTFSATGKVTKVEGIKTGDRDLDREIRNRIMRASLHPNVLQGSSAGGEGSFVISIQIR